MATFFALGLLGYIYWKILRPSPTGATERASEGGITRKVRQPQNTLKIDKPHPYDITNEIKNVLLALEGTDNIFLTGKAGTGKSTLLRYFRATTKKAPVVIAPTGIAAINVQGSTIHRLFGFGIDITPNRVRKVSFEKAKIFKNLKMLVIDEISMVRADLFECIDRFLKLNTDKPTLPFGGVQIILIGDLYQLPPVVNREEKKLFETYYKSPFFFSTTAYKNGNFKNFELNNVFRQSDMDFIDALNSIRKCKVNDKHLKLINERIISSQEEYDSLTGYVHLVTTNKMAKEINDTRMSELTAAPRTYKGTFVGEYDKNDAPTDVELTLKAGAKIMLLNNDPERRWVNGDIVTLLETRPNSIFVQFPDNTVIEVFSNTWENIKFIFDEELEQIIPVKAGSFTQIPTKPAWAITIHKSQGQSLDKVYIDLGRGAFAEGQTYVALSRCKTLEGLKLSAPINRNDIFINKAVEEFMNFSSDKSCPTFAPTEDMAHKDSPIETIAANSHSTGNDTRLSHKEYILQEIKRLRTKNFKGIHVVYSGFNAAFRDYFKEDPIPIVKKLEAEGVVMTKPVKGGVMLYIKNE